MTDLPSRESTPSMEKNPEKACPLTRTKNGSRPHCAKQAAYKTVVSKHVPDLLSTI